MEQAQPALKRRRKDWRSFDFLNKSAQRAYNAAYKVFAKLGANQRGKLTTGVAEVSEARFRMGESIYVDIKYRTRLKPRLDIRKLDKFIKAMLEEIKKRGDLIQTAQNVTVK